MNLAKDKNRLFSRITWFVITAVILLTMVLIGGACTSASDTGEINNSDTQKTTEPVLSDTLLRGCERAETSRNFSNAGLAVGETAVGFTLQDTQGNMVSLSGLLVEKPVMMVFGSFT